MIFDLFDYFSHLFHFFKFWSFFLSFASFHVSDFFPERGPGVFARLKIFELFIFQLFKSGVGFFFCLKFF